MKRFAFITISAAAIVAVIVMAVLMRRQNVPLDPRTGCPSVDAPVCGTDGVTYRNECEARASGATIERPGACVSPTALTGSQRKYLLWLLRARMDRGLSGEPVVFVSEERDASCDECTLFRYGWRDGQATASVIVQNDVVIRATDTEGVDYVAGVSP